ncbi:hypothetical protein ACFSJ3_14510 [Corallincola platygyrae]|uniref:PEP-CTERM sorting domain-containing protein n=1 Tax=Corallincola platygyrae TaxID=1193278 RepID=A0ABW4XQ52_9GAMM
MKILTRYVVVFALPLLFVPLVADAGLIKITVDKNTDAVVLLLDKDGFVVGRDAKEDVNGDKLIEFAFEKTRQERAKEVHVFKTSDGKAINYKLKFKKNEVNLASFEPFEISTFGAVSDGFLGWEMDVVNFFDQGLQFDLGDVLTVTNGMVSETEYLSFYDQNGMGFNGEIRVENIDQFLPLPRDIPEPSQLILFSACLGFLIRLHRCRRER